MGGLAGMASLLIAPDPHLTPLSFSRYFAHDFRAYEVSLSILFFKLVNLFYSQKNFRDFFLEIF